MRFLALLFCAAALCSAQQGYSVETLAGNGVAGFTGDGGAAGGAQLNGPTSLALDSSGRLYIADTGNRRVRRVDTNGRIATAATSEEPFVDIAVDIRNALYLAYPARIHSISATGVESDVAGPGDGWTAIGAIAGEPTGTLLVADGNKIYRVATNGITDVATLPAPVTSLYAGSTGNFAIAGDTAYSVGSNGLATPVQGARPVTPGSRIAADRWGDVYVSGVRITKIIQGREYPLTGLTEPGYSGDGGPAVAALVNNPTGLVVDRGGNVFFSDTGNQRVRLLRPAFAGNIEATLPVDAAQEVWPKGVMLAWTTFLQPSTYEVFFGTSPDGLTRVASTSGGSHKLAENLADRTRYYWQVRTQYPPQPPTESPLFSFTTTTSAAVPPPRPSNPTPPNNSFAQSVSPLLAWSGGGAIQYVLYVGLAENSLSPAGTVTEPRLTLNGLIPETTYFWQVVAVNEVGGAQSPIWQFTTGPANGYPWVLEPLAGAAHPVEDGLNATEAVLNSPRQPAADLSGNIYFIANDRVIRRVGTDGKLGTLYTLGSGTLTALASDPNNGQMVYATADHIYRIGPRNRVRTYVTGQIGRRGYGGDNGPAAQAVFDGISSVAVDRRGAMYIADTANNRVRVLLNGTVRTFAGTGVCGQHDGSGTATALPLCAPSQVTVDLQNNVYIYSGNMLIRVGTDGQAQRLAGNGTAGYTGDNGPATDALLGPASGLAVDRFGFIYIADPVANTVRLIDPNGIMTTWAGVPTPGGGFAGDRQGAADARFSRITGIALDNDYLVVADTGNHRIRQADNVDVFRTVAGTDGFRGDRGNAAAAWLFGPTSVAVDGGGNVFIADSLNNRVRRVTPTRSIDTIAGGGSGQVASAAQGTDARDLRLDLSSGAALAFDERGNLMLNSALPPTAAPASSSTPDGPTQSILNLLPNSIITSATLMRIGQVGGMVRGRFGEVYVSDAQNHRIWRISPDGSSAVIAGTGAAGAAGDGGQAVTAQLNTPRSLAINPDGDLYVAELGRIRRITANGAISTAAFENATGLAFDRDGLFYVAAGRSVFWAIPDRRTRDTLTLVRIAGRENGTVPTAEVPALTARTTEIRGLAAGPSGELVFADYGENAVRRMFRNIPSVATLVSGDGQTLNSRNSVTSPLRVRISGRTGVGVAGVTVRLVNVTDPARPAVVGTAVTDATGQADLFPVITTRAAEHQLETLVFGVTTPVRFRLVGRSDTESSQ